MELQSLRTFQMVAVEGGVLAASRKLNTVQSNVTARIKRLEEEFGSALFHRKGRGVVLSASGRVLLEYAEKMLQLERQTSAALRQVGENCGEIRIGTMESFAAMRLPFALKQLTIHHPGISLAIKTGTSAWLVEQVLAHKLDVAFVGGPVSHPELVGDVVVDEELVLVSAKDMEVASSSLILFREGCAYRERALAWQRESGLAAVKVMELGTLEGILGCVAVGLGCTLMPLWVVKESRFWNELNVTQLSSHIAHVPTLMVRHKDVADMPAFETLKQTAMV